MKFDSKKAAKEFNRCVKLNEELIDEKIRLSNEVIGQAHEIVKFKKKIEELEKQIEELKKVKETALRADNFTHIVRAVKCVDFVTVESGLDGSGAKRMYCQVCKDCLGSWANIGDGLTNLYNHFRAKHWTLK